VSQHGSGLIPPPRNGHRYATSWWPKLPIDRTSEGQSRHRNRQERHTDSARDQTDRRRHSRGSLHNARLEASGRASGDNFVFESRTELDANLALKPTNFLTEMGLRNA
jgi:hypothetical protein